MPTATLKLITNPEKIAARIAELCQDAEPPTIEAIDLATPE